MENYLAPPWKPTFLLANKQKKQWQMCIILCTYLSTYTKTLKEKMLKIKLVEAYNYKIIYCIRP